MYFNKYDIYLYDKTKHRMRKLLAVFALHSSEIFRIHFCIKPLISLEAGINRPVEEL